MIAWFRRFWDIPEVSTDDRPVIDRARLAGADAVPELRVFELEGKRRESLWWQGDGGGGTTASPVHNRTFGVSKEAPTSELLRNAYEGLELPGVPRDYHFLIQGCANGLWGRRRQEPELLEQIEKLCWLDVRLLEACPDAVRDEFSDSPRFYRVETFSILIEMYQREGSLHETLDVAQRAERLGQGSDAKDELMERMEMVETEDSG